MIIHENGGKGYRYLIIINLKEENNKFIEFVFLYFDR